MSPEISRPSPVKSTTKISLKFPDTFWREISLKIPETFRRKISLKFPENFRRNKWKISRKVSPEKFRKFPQHGQLRFPRQIAEKWAAGSAPDPAEEQRKRRRKFCDEDGLTVAAGWGENDGTESGPTDVRVITTIDGLNRHIKV